jgi:hypothetical protein
MKMKGDRGKKMEKSNEKEQTKERTWTEGKRKR